MFLYQVCSSLEAERILERGFTESGRFFGYDHNGEPLVLAGVWLFDKPVWDNHPIDIALLPTSMSCLEIDVPDAFLADDEGHEHPENAYQSWCFTKDVANQFFVAPVSETEPVYA
jgi:hypothetical protein